MPICPHCNKDFFCAVCGATPMNVGTTKPCSKAKGAIWAHVVDTKGTDLPDARITVNASGEDSDGVGIAKFDPLDAGSYTVKIDPLTSPLSDEHYLPATTAYSVGVTDGRITYVLFELPARPEPKLEIADPRIIIVKHAYHGKPKPGVAAHRVPVKLSAVGTYDGGGTFTVPAEVDIFESDTSTTKLASPLAVANGDLAGKTVYLEANAASGSNLGTELKFELTGGAIPAKPAATVKITCVKLVLESYEARAKPTVDPVLMAEDVKIEPGRPVPWDTQTVERVKVVLKQAEPTDFTGNIVVEPIMANLQAYDDEKPPAGAPVGGLSFANSTLAGAGKTLWTQGTTVSAAAGDSGWRVAVEGVTGVGGPVEGDRVTMTVFKLAVEMFRGQNVSPTMLQVAPFYCTDDAAELDGAVPLAMQNRVAATRPASLDAIFAAPKKTEFGEKDNANADPRVYRLRVKPEPSLDAFSQTDIVATVNVLNKLANPIVFSTAMGIGPAAGTASHANGMQVPLKKNPGAASWVSPYLRTLTTALDRRSKQADYLIVHSLPPMKKEDFEDGKQLGRKMRSLVTLYGARVTQDFTLGGQPFARVPIKFLFVAPAAQLPAMEATAKQKILQLNQYWASSGLEFSLEGGVAIEHATAPARNLITIGEYTGCDTVYFDEFRLTLDLKVNLNGIDEDAQVEIDLGANSTSAQVAAGIRTALQAWTPGPNLPGVTLDADVFDIPDPRLLLAFDLQPEVHDLTTGPLRVPAPLIGTRGPSDVVVKAAGAGVQGVQIAGLATTWDFATVTTVIKTDITAPPVNRNFHDGKIAPPCATERHWIRTFSPADKRYVTCIIEDPATEPQDIRYREFCQENFCALFDTDTTITMNSFDANMQTANISPGGPDALTLINPGLWNDPHARQIFFLRDRGFSTGPDEVQHEVGHALTGLNHTIYHPDWFYSGELMHNGSGKPDNKTIRMTSQQLFVDGLQKYTGTWCGLMVDCPKGYNGAVRDGIRNLPFADWLVTGLDPTQDAWS